MPIRLYRCEIGHETEVPLPSGPYETTMTCPCGAPAKSVPAPFAGAIDKESRAAAFAKKGLVPWEKGMDVDAERAQRYHQEKHFADLSHAVEQVVREDNSIRPD